MIQASTATNSKDAVTPQGSNGAPTFHRTGPETGRERKNGAKAVTDDKPMPEEEMPEETASISLSEFIEIYKDAIARTVTEAYAPRYRPGEPGQDQPLPRLIRRPMGAQEHAIRGAALSLEVNPGTVIVGEMGTGKTYIGAAAAHMNGHRNVLVLCPPHLAPKWKREIEMTVPGARAAIVRTITGLQRLDQPAPREAPGSPSCPGRQPSCPTAGNPPTSPGSPAGRTPQGRTAARDASSRSWTRTASPYCQGRWRESA